MFTVPEAFLGKFLSGCDKEFFKKENFKSTLAFVNANHLQKRVFSFFYLILSFLVLFEIIPMRNEYVPNVKAKV